MFIGFNDFVDKNPILYKMNEFVQKCGGPVSKQPIRY